jgi:hypothetical protein
MRPPRARPAAPARAADAPAPSPPGGAGPRRLAARPCPFGRPSNSCRGAPPAGTVGFPVDHDVATTAPPAPAKAPASAPPVVVATPAAVGGAPMGADQVLSLQRTAGNRAVCRAIAGGLIQRDDTGAQAAASVAVAGVTVTPAKSTTPTESGVTITAKATPANASGVKFTLDAGSAAVGAGTSIDEKTGKVTLDAKQAGGTLKATATSDDGTSAWSDFKLVEKPTAIASTTGAATGDYEAAFTHTFTGSSGGSAGLDGENINEKFDSLSVPSPFGGNFTLQANAAGSHGWDLDASGMMAGPDNVSIGAKDVDAGPFVKSASNPTPAKSLPQGFTMTQKLHAKTFPSGQLEGTPFTTTGHVRTLDEKNGKLVFLLKSGTKEVSIPYAGPAVYRNAKADKTTVQASAPKPAKGDWARNTVQVSVTAEGSGASPSYSIVGNALGCEVDVNGKVKIGDQAGTITVRAGEAKRYDEVTITITAPPAQPPVPKATAGDGGEAVPSAAGEPAPAPSGEPTPEATPGGEPTP